MSEVEERWWRNPTGIIAAVTIATLILGFFYTRERQLWEDKMAISSLEERGAAAILKVESELEKIRVQLGAMQRSLWELERVNRKKDEEQSRALLGGSRAGKGRRRSGRTAIKVFKEKDKQLKRKEKKEKNAMTMTSKNIIKEPEEKGKAEPPPPRGTNTSTTNRRRRKKTRKRPTSPRVSSRKTSSGRPRAATRRTPILRRPATFPPRRQSPRKCATPSWPRGALLLPRQLRAGSRKPRTTGSCGC